MRLFHAAFISTAVLLSTALGGCATAGIGAKIPSVQALRETPPVNALVTDDAADDPAIWVAPDVLKSRIIGTQKKGGIFVYDLNAALVQEAPGGQPNNVDLKDGFPFADGVGAIVSASDRSDHSMPIWKLRPDGTLDPKPRARIPSGFAEIYGFCMGRIGDQFYAVATSKIGEVGLWKLTPSSDGAAGTLVKKWSLGSISEGCVVDEHAEAFYVSQELVGLWRFDMKALGEPVSVDRVAPQGNLAPDVEGVTLWDGGEGAGYLIVSAQGENRFAVYDRKGGAYRGSFQIGAGAAKGVDGVSGTDGLDVTSVPLGADFPRGLVVVQDDENTDPVQPQNFKYVSWADVEKALGLTEPVR